MNIDLRTLMDECAKKLRDSDEAYLSNTKFPLLDVGDRQARITAFSQLINTPPFERYGSVHAIQFSQQGLDMINKGFTDWYAYQESLEPKKINYWKLATIIVGVVAAYPSYYTIWSSGKVEDIEQKLENTEQDYQAQIDSLNEEIKSLYLTEEAYREEVRMLENTIKLTMPQYSPADSSVKQ